MKFFANFLILTLILFYNQFLFAEGNLSVNNYLLVNENTLEFDVYINSTMSNFEVSSYQCVLSINNEILNDGSLTFSYINGSSDISNKPLTSFIMQENEIDRFLCFASNFGIDTISTSIKKIGRFRLENTVPFGEYLCELNWMIIQNPRTIITGSQVVDITNQFTFSGLNFIVPVELISFSGSVDRNNIVLNWSTATETNNHGFEVERKIITTGDGEWMKIGFKEGKGTTVEKQKYQFTDNINLLKSTSLIYRLKQVDFNGSYEYSDEVLLANPAPSHYELQQNYPNPFNPNTTISYSLPQKSQVELLVFNTLGEKVIQLVNAEKEEGSYSVELNSTLLPSGVYFYRLQAGDFVETKKMLLIK